MCLILKKDLVYFLRFPFLNHVLVFPAVLIRSAGAVEYTDCTSAEGWDPPPINKCPAYDTKQSEGWGYSSAGALGNV